MSPRPFAMHLALATVALLSSKSGLPRLNGGSPSLKPRPSPAWPNLPEGLAAQLAALEPACFDRALDNAVARAAADYARGMEAYRRHPYRRASEEGRVVWRQGGTALLRHGDGGVPSLFVPSLVNRGWVLDLIPGHGMLSWLARQGIDAYRMEWGPLGTDERGFDIGEYVVRRLEPALDEVRRVAGRAPVLVGYCMGGLLALAAAVRRPDVIGGLVLLATPWDFHVEGAARGGAMAAFYRASRPFLAQLDELPIDMMQALFTLHDPIVALRKFRRFAAMDPDSDTARTFVALEDWLNDGIAVALPVADEALLGWYEANTPGRSQWRVQGTLVDPAAVSVPTLIVVPGADRIVPPASAAAIAAKLRRADRRDLPLGHIGMVVGREAETALWRPLAEWILAEGAVGA